MRKFSVLYWPLLYVQFYIDPPCEKRQEFLDIKYDKHIDFMTYQSSKHILYNTSTFYSAAWSIKDKPYIIHKLTRRKGLQITREPCILNIMKLHKIRSGTEWVRSKRIYSLNSYSLSRQEMKKKYLLKSRKSKVNSQK